MCKIQALEMNVSKSPSPLFIAPKGALENRDTGPSAENNEITVRTQSPNSRG